MPNAYLLLAPAAVLAVLLLVGFVGCDFHGPQPECTDQQETLYPDVALSLSPQPVAYWRLQEPSSTQAGDPATSATGQFNSTFQRALNPLPDDPATRSPAANPIRLELGVTPGLLQTDPAATAMRVQGSGVQVQFDAALNTSTFTVVALVQPEWDVTDPALFGRYYCVFESSDQPAAGSGQSKKLGFALYAGPEDPSLPNTPYRWQFWIGDGTGFRQLKEQSPQPDGHPMTPPFVENAPTFLCIQFDGVNYVLYYYTPGRDLDDAKYFMVAPAADYQPTTSGDLTIGASQGRKSLIAPFPGPNRVLYPFIGKIEEVVLYSRAIGNLCVIHLGMGAFTS